MDPFPWLGRWIARVFRFERFPRVAVWARRSLGAWVAFHALAVLLVAIPVPHPLDTTVLGRPTVAREVTRWHERLSELGYRGSRQSFEGFLVHVSQGWAHGRNDVLAPLTAYLDVVRVRQAWYMFTAPDRAPERFRVEVSQKAKRSRDRRRPPKLEPVFEMGQPVLRPDLLSPGFVLHYRVRRALLVAAWMQGDEHLSRLCSAFEERLSAHSEHVRSVRCSMVQEEVEHPSHLGEPRARRTTRAVVSKVKR